MSEGKFMSEPEPEVCGYSYDHTIEDGDEECRECGAIVEQNEETQEFTVAFTAPAWTTVRVEAKDVDEAIEKAGDELYGSDRGLCYNCSCPNGIGLRDSGNITREWPEEMTPVEVTDQDSKIIWKDSKLY